MYLWLYLWGYPIEILENICEPTLNLKMPTCTPVGGTCVYTCVIPRGLLGCGLLNYPYGYSRLPLGGYVCGYVGGYWSDYVYLSVPLVPYTISCSYPLATY